MSDVDSIRTFTQSWWNLYWPVDQVDAIVGGFFERWCRHERLIPHSVSASVEWREPQRAYFLTVSVHGVSAGDAFDLDGSASLRSMIRHTLNNLPDPTRGEA